MPCVSREVMVKTPCLWQKEIYQYLNCSRFGFEFVLSFLQAPVLIWICLRVSQRQKTQLIVAFLCRTPQTQQHLFLTRSLQSHPLAAPTANSPGPVGAVPGHSPDRQQLRPLSPGVEPVREALSRSDISLPLAAAAFLKAFSFSTKISLVLWTPVERWASARERPSF